MKRRIPAFLLAVLMLINLAACGGASTGNDTSADDSTTPAEDTTPAEPEYIFPTDYSGQTFTILNVDDIFSIHCKLDPEESTGESLNDAQFNAIIAFEEATGTDLQETNVHLQDEFQDYYRQFILGGEDIFDIVFISQRDCGTFGAEGYMQNLLEIDGFQFENDYWNSAFNDAIIFNDNLFVAQSYAHLSILDSIGAYIFNRSMMEKYNLELPYQTVKDGKWTMDVFQTYLKAAANLNGDESFTWTADGECTWGLVLPWNTGYLHDEMGEHVVELQDGQLVLTVGTERFYNVCEKIASLFNMEDGCVYLADMLGEDDPASYVGVFENERALFGQTEVAKVGRLRDKNYSFGIVPKPKYDENQENYCSIQAYPASGISIPITVVDTEKAARLSDALSYIFYRDVWPIFTETTVEQKNLRDEESIEMLNILVESAMPSYITIFGITDIGFHSTLADSLRAGNSAVGSIVDSMKPALQAAVNTANNSNS